MVKVLTQSCASVNASYGAKKEIDPDQPQHCAAKITAYNEMTLNRSNTQNMLNWLHLGQF